MVGRDDLRSTRQFAANIFNGIFAVAHGQLLTRWALVGGHNLVPVVQLAAHVFHHHVVYTVGDHDGVAGATAGVDVLKKECVHGCLRLVCLRQLWEKLRIAVSHASVTRSPVSATLTRISIRMWVRPRRSSLPTTSPLTSSSAPTGINR